MFSMPSGLNVCQHTWALTDQVYCCMHTTETQCKRRHFEPVSILMGEWQALPL